MCKTEGCYKPNARGRKICSSCVIERFKEKNPEKYSYFVLRQNAKRRGKEFKISFECFLNFCKKHEYLYRKGITKIGLHIDRIDECLGYIEGNLQVLTNSENVKKIRAFEAGKYRVYITNRNNNNKQDSEPF